MIKKSELTKEYYKTGELAKMIGKQTRTVQSYCIRGDINSIIIPSGKRIISRDEVIKYLKSSNLLYEDDNKIDLIYARVSTNKQKNRGDLDRQIEYIIREIITKNPKNLQFVELEGAQIPRTLDDVDIAAISTNFVLDLGMSVAKDALLLEDANSPYANIIVTRAGNENNPKIKALVDAVLSPDTKNFIITRYKGEVIPAF